MICLELYNPSFETKELLTQQEKLEYIDGLLKTGFHHNGELFVPPDYFYEIGAIDNDRLYDLAKEILKWLGVKHSGLHIQFSDEVSMPGRYRVQANHHSILVPYSLSTNIFACAGAVTHLAMHYFLTSRKKTVLTDPEENEALVELATIEAGLGILVMNGWAAGLGWKQKLAGRVMAKSQANFQASLVKDFIRTHSIPPAVWAEAMLPAARRAIGYRGKLRHFRNYIDRVQQASAQAHRKIILASTLLALVAVGGSYVISQRPKTMPRALQEQREKIDLLRVQYDRCSATVVKKRNTLDQSDLFMIRDIQADESRCTSLRNVYNYEVDLYNKALEKL